MAIWLNDSNEWMKIKQLAIKQFDNLAIRKFFLTPNFSSR